MANLDDFFAKKDKKKGKTSKQKFLTTDELVKNLEDTSKREVIAKIKKNEITLPETDVTSDTTIIEEEVGVTIIEHKPTAADEEWKEYEEEQRKDYSGLKIGKMQINNEDDDDLSQDDDSDENESDSANADPNLNFGVSGPWKKVVPAEEVTQINVVENEKRIYILPALRAAQGSASGMRRNRAAPDITNADFFPTLGAARPEEQRKKKNEPAFEEVKHGGRIQRVQPTVATPVSVTNRFQGLDEDDS